MFTAIKNYINQEIYLKNKDKLFSAFPSFLKSDVEVVLAYLPLYNKNLFNSTFLDIHIDNELLKIPYRIHFDELNENDISKLTDRQRTILFCVYSRHHDGCLRQKYLERLRGNKEYWVIPFIFNLLGEYVFEILEILDEYINQDNIDLYKKFSKENAEYLEGVEARIISYWNEYYRRSGFSKLEDYLGYKIFHRILDYGI